ncbi:MAG TPA: hypothetical protein VIM86_01980 [Thermodesulfobacteriota bacterium]
MPSPIVFRIVLAAAWLNLAVLAADALYNVVKALANALGATGPAYF